MREEDEESENDTVPPASCPEDAAPFPSFITGVQLEGVLEYPDPWCAYWPHTPRIPIGFECGAVQESVGYVWRRFGSSEIVKSETLSAIPKIDSEEFNAQWRYQMLMHGPEEYRQMVNKLPLSTWEDSYWRIAVNPIYQELVGQGALPRLFPKRRIKPQPIRDLLRMGSPDERITDATNFYPYTALLPPGVEFAYSDTRRAGSASTEDWRTSGYRSERWTSYDIDNVPFYAFVDGTIIAADKCRFPTVSEVPAFTTLVDKLRNNLEYLDIEDRQRLKLHLCSFYHWKWYTVQHLEIAVASVLSADPIQSEAVVDVHETRAESWRSWVQPIPRVFRPAFHHEITESTYWPCTTSLPNGVRRGVVVVDREKLTVRYSYELLNGTIIPGEVFLDAYCDDHFWAGIHRLEGLVASPEFDEKWRKEFATLASRGVIRDMDKFDASRAIMKFFDRHPNFKHCDARTDPIDSTLKPNWVESDDWNNWPVTDELPVGVKIAFFQWRKVKLSRTHQQKLKLGILVLSSGDAMLIDDIRINPQRSDERLQRATSAVMANDDLPREYLYRYAQAVKLFTVCGGETELQSFLACLANPLLKRFCPYTEVAPPGVSIRMTFTVNDGIPLLQVPDGEQVSMSQLRLPDDERALLLLERAWNFIRDQSYHPRLNPLLNTIGKYYRWDSTSIEDVRIAMARATVKDIPTGSIWQPKRLRQLLAS